MSSPVGPLLSVVVPVFRVADYLPACLDSTLAEAGPGVEVVAVDDGCPDGSGAILAEHARRDPRLRVVRLATNVGLGRARNAGLAQARGSYVWFVDGDDWLPPGSVPAVRARLAETAPDVLVVGHAEVYADGRVGRSATPARASRVELLRLPLSTSACTKVVRRDLLAQLDLRFPPGWYEDVAYSLPLLLAAPRLAALDRVCYHYRQRAGEAITKSVSPRHFDVFGQYERVWAVVDQAAPRYDAYRPALFRLMLDHLLVIAGNDRRLPARLRHVFFRRVVRSYHRWLPAAGYPAPSGADGLKHRLVRSSSYEAYAALRLAWRLWQAAGATVRGLPGRSRSRPGSLDAAGPRSSGDRAAVS